MERIRFIDSHTCGEPTRVILDGYPPFSSLDPKVVRDELRTKFADFMRATVTEPRASEIVIGAILLPARSPEFAAGVVYYNNADVLSMCGHGTIGLAETLRYLQRLPEDKFTIETPVGTVEVTVEADGYSFENIPSYRLSKDVPMTVKGKQYVGDIAWGGNWFYLVRREFDELHPSHVKTLHQEAKDIRAELDRHPDLVPPGQVLDHVQFSAHHPSIRNRGRNFILCPGGEYDRSPCGTGTSAKLSCLAADQELAPGEIWTHESITSTHFEASYRKFEDKIIPRIKGTAFVTAEGCLLLDSRDPLRNGVQTNFK